MNNYAERFPGEPTGGWPELSMIEGEGDRWLTPTPLTDAGQLAVAIGASTTTIKESLQQLFGKSDTDELQTIAEKVYRDGAKTILQDLRMLPSDDRLDRETSAAFKAAYEEAYKRQSELSTAERAYLLDKYEYHPAITSIDRLRDQFGVSPQHTVPMLRTMLLLLDKNLD